MISATNHEPATGDDQLRSQLVGLVRAWPLIMMVTLIGLLGAVAVNSVLNSVYESRLTFFLSTSGAVGSNALQADEFAQRRINSYVGVVNSDRLAGQIIGDLRLDLSTSSVSGMLQATPESDTVLFKVSVKHTDPDLVARVAGSVARNLDPVIRQLDATNGQNPNVGLQVISGPTSPEAVSPRRTMNLGLGTLFGLTAGLLIALVRQQFDTSIRSVDQMSRFLQLSNLAVFTLDRSIRRQAATKRGVPLSWQGTDPRIAESFRQLRTNLRFVNAAKSVSVLVVTSAVESEGKTTVASNLAAAFARSQVRTLLVDADLRRPRVAGLLGLENTVGLTTLLLGDATVDEVIQPSGIPGLDALPAGTTPPNPSELLGSPAMQAFIADVRQRYQMIIIDTPPVTPVTDGVVTSLLADGVLVVVRYGKVAQAKVRHAVSSLHSVGARVLGTVLTMVPPGAASASESAYYSSSDG